MKVRSNERLHLFGFLDSAPAPSFLTPVFSGSGEDLFLQDANVEDVVVSVTRLTEAARDRIMPFDAEDDPIGDPHPSTAVGEPVLHAFRVGQKKIWIDNRAQLSETLRNWQDSRPVDPFIALEIAEFTEAAPHEQAKLVEKAQRALARAGVRQSRVWAATQIARLGLTPPEKGIAGDEAGLPESVFQLPLVHVCSALDLRDILERGSVAARPDDVFGGLACYFYYGRPAYRVRPDPVLPPVAIVLRPPADLKPQRVFPFDSGAFSQALKGFDGTTLEDYQLHGDLSDIDGFIAAAFGTPQDYMEGRLTNPDHYVDRGPDASGLILQLGRDGEPPAIEIAYDQDIPVTNETFCALLAPKQIVEDLREKLLSSYPELRILAVPTFPEFAYVEDFSRRLLDFYVSDLGLELDSYPDEFADPEAHVR